MSRWAPVATALLMGVLSAACSRGGETSSTAPSAEPAGTQAASGGTASEDASASASRSPTAPPSEPDVAGKLARDDWVVLIADGINVRDEPSTAAHSWGAAPRGLEGLLIDGPVEADGHVWYMLATGRIPESDCGAPPEGQPSPSDPIECDLWGWVSAASADGEPWLQRAEPECPEEPTTVREIAAQSEATLLYCFRGEELVIQAYKLAAHPGGGRGCTSNDAEPAWLWCPHYVMLQDGPTWGDMRTEINVRLHPSLGSCDFEGNEPPETCPFAPYVGQSVTVVGMYDHPDAQSCRSAEVEQTYPWRVESLRAACRATFVITEIRPGAS